MRIPEKLGPPDITKRENQKKATGNANSLFAVEIGRKYIANDCYEQEVEDLRRDIDLAGDELEKDPNLCNFKKFRDLLSRLATRISNEAYRLEKIGGTPKNPRYYEIITIINTEADRLYNVIVNEQRDRMAITDKVIGIKGLVVDLIT